MSTIASQSSSNDLAVAGPRHEEIARGSNPSKALVLLMLLGALLRILRYAANRSLWLDEAYLANSVLTYSVRQLLTKPLLYWQAAPPGFLLLQKAAASVLGTSEDALRIVPLLAGIASILLFYGIIRRCLGSTAQILAMAMFVTLDPLIYYSAEAKQYGLDVMIALAILVTALRLRERPGSWGRLIMLAAVGLLGIFCSHPAIFTLAGTEIVLVADLLHQRRFVSAMRLSCVVLLCGCGFALDSFFFLRPLMHHDGLNAYWAADFMPYDALGALKWLGWELYELYHGYATMWLTLVDTAILATLIGVVPLWRRDRPMLAFLVLPLLLALGAAMAHAYPFGSRLTLFLVPSLVVLIGAGSAMIWESVIPGRRFIAALILLSILLPTAVRDVYYVVFPQQREEIRPVLAYIRDHKRPGDTLYVFYISQVPFRYYESRFGLTPDRFGLADMPTIYGEPGEADPSLYRTDLSRLRGRGRVWVLVSHPRALGGPDEEKIFPQILNEWGKAIDHIQAFHASATLYEMNKADHARK